MPRDLLLMRAGKSRKIRDGDRSVRELKDKGKRGAQKMGIWLCKRGLHDVQVLSSPRADAKVSAEKLLKAAGSSAERITVDARLAKADVNQGLNLLAEANNSTGPLLCVGHKRCIDNLADHIADQPTTLGAGELLHLRIPDGWSALFRGAGEIIEHVTPQSLPDGFPYPDIGWAERRERPAYYYSQSAVLPFRRMQGRLEILIITSSKQTHWVLPKGIHEPGLTAADSAAKEALEEAGIRGRVDTVSIGRFHQEKWGAECSVDVFPMEITEILPPEEWAENHRGRCWVSVETAVARLRNRGLAEIVARFRATSSAGL
ncbi:NUDIX domain-containing protein [Sedimentitalea sp.]|uniref:NUDIX domain-containing protein n=1 Tax=Sedimentitalea sp. TaxID=2048915 RepID=UPI003297169F